MSAGSARLTGALKTLKLQWEETKDSWNDKIRQDFESTHMLPLESRASAAARGMDQLSEVLKKVRHDCG